MAKEGKEMKKGEEGKHREKEGHVVEKKEKRWKKNTMREKNVKWFVIFLFDHLEINIGVFFIL